MRKTDAEDFIFRVQAAFISQCIPSMRKSETLATTALKKTSNVQKC